MLKIWFKPSNTIELINCNDQNFLKKLARIFSFQNSIICQIYNLVGLSALLVPKKKE